MKTFWHALSEIHRPWLALFVYFGIGFLLYTQGPLIGSLFLGDVVLGIVIYKLLSRY